MYGGELGIIGGLFFFVFFGGGMIWIVCKAIKERREKTQREYEYDRAQREYRRGRLSSLDYKRIADKSCPPPRRPVGQPGPILRRCLPLSGCPGATPHYS